MAKAARASDLAKNDNARRKVDAINADVAKANKASTSNTKKTHMKETNQKSGINSSATSKLMADLRKKHGGNKAGAPTIISLVSSSESSDGTDSLDPGSDDSDSGSDSSDSDSDSDSESEQTGKGRKRKQRKAQTVKVQDMLEKLFQMMSVSETTNHGQKTKARHRRGPKPKAMNAVEKMKAEEKPSDRLKLLVSTD